MNALRISSLVLVMIILIAFSWQHVEAAWSTNPSENTPVCALGSNQIAPQMVSDGAGGTIIAWRDYRSLEYDIYVQRLDASGNKLWDANGLVVCSAAGSQGNHRMVSDGAGGAIIAWSDYRTGSPEIYAQRVASDGTMLWAVDGVSICSTTGSPGEMALTADGAGGAVIAWADDRGVDRDIYVQRVSETGSVLWTVDGVPACTAASNQYGITVVSDAAGGVVLAWCDHRSGSYFDVYLQRVDASGSMLWTANGISVGTTTEEEQYPVLVGDGAGGAFIASFDDSSNDLNIYTQRFDGNGSQLWTTGGEPVSSTSGGQENPAMTGDGQDGVIIAWFDQRSVDYGIYAQRFDNAGTALWTVNGAAVCTAGGSQNDLQLAGDGYGGALITWTDTRSGGVDIYAQRMDTWGNELWSEDGVAVCMAADTQLRPMLCGDGQGGAIITWDDQRSGTDYDIYAQQVEWSGRPGGSRWSTNPETYNVVHEFPADPGSYRRTTDGAGGMIIAWSNDSRAGEILAQRMDRNGAPQWDPEGVAICTEAGERYHASPVSDGAGGAIIIWSDRRSGDSKIFAQRVDAFGNTLWATGGIAVCSAAGTQNSSRSICDGSGGAIIAWKNTLSFEIDIHAQRIDASGAAMWNADGVPVCAATGSQGNIQITGDGDGGAIITWEDGRTGDDVFAQRIDSSGTARWGVDGTAVCTYPSHQNSPILVSDGHGGAIIAWVDDRSLSWDIYAQRMDEDGFSVWGVEQAVCSTSDGHNEPELTSDGQGGAIITWRVTSSGDFGNILAQRVDMSGHTRWAENGEIICQAEEIQNLPHIDTDGEGGAIISWSDRRSGWYAAYAQRVNHNGDTLWASDGLEVSTWGVNQEIALIDDGDSAWMTFKHWTYVDPVIAVQRVDLNGYLGDPAPIIREVVDSPLDQGGEVVLSWEASCYDALPHQVIDRYSIWRRLPRDPERSGWVLVDEVPAYYQAEYGFDAPTYGDWTGGSDFPLTEYKVIAHTTNSLIFWESEVIGGCSVDNLAPGAPLTLLGLPDESDVLLTWEASGHHDEDLAHYNVYRGSSPGFTADETSLIGTVTDIEYTDPNPGYGTWYYRVAGEDVHGNVGTPSNEAAVPVSTATVAASLTCAPSSGVLPFVTGFNVQLTNQYQGQIRRIAGRIHVTLANGTFYGNWRAGSTNVQPGSTFVTSWNQPIPALAPLVGDNLFRLLAADVTPAPYNQPPYPPAGDTDSDTATVTGMAP